MEIKDSGERQEFNTGAVRDITEDKPALELISPFFERRLGMWLEKGSRKYAKRNWEKGMPIERCLASLKRHTTSYVAGDDDEDHLAAIACNIMFIIHYEEMIKRGVLPQELAYNPKYKVEKFTKEQVEESYKKVMEVDNFIIVEKQESEKQEWTQLE